MDGFDTWRLSLLNSMFGREEMLESFQFGYCCSSNGFLSEPIGVFLGFVYSAVNGSGCCRLSCGERSRQCHSEMGSERDSRKVLDLVAIATHWER